MTSRNMLQLACSDLRRNILISLNEGEKSLADLREELKIRSTTALHALKELGNGNLTFQAQNKNYALTSIGKIIAIKLIDTMIAAEALKKHERFWLDHDLSGIPEHLLGKIGWLKNSNLIQINPLDVYKTHSNYLSFIKEAKWIKGVSPIYSPDYIGIFKELVNKNLETILILDKDVFSKSTEMIGIENLNAGIKNSRLEILIAEEKLNVAFTVTDSFFSLGLFNKNGIYDTAFDLVATDDLAIKWGVELFNFYIPKARKYEI